MARKYDFIDFVKKNVFVLSNDLVFEFSTNEKGQFNGKGYILTKNRK